MLDIDGNVLEGNFRPSSDTETHLEIYRNFADANCVIHTHSEFATVFAQARREIPAYGTTHGDYFYDSVPCTREMTPEEIASEYEKIPERLLSKPLPERIRRRCRESLSALMVRLSGAKRQMRHLHTPLCLNRWRKWRILQNNKRVIKV